MPKGRGKKNGGMDRPVLVPFRTMAYLPFSNSVATTVLETDLALANLGARAVAVGSTFEYFRFKSLKAYQYTTCVGPVFDADATGGTGTEGNMSVEHALAFIESNAALTGTATTLTQMAQYEVFKAGGPYSRLGVTIHKRLLSANAYKWFNTASTGASTDDLSPGMFVTAAVNALSIVSGWECAVRLVIEGVLEFRGMITPALAFGAPGGSNVPAERKDESSDDEDITEMALMLDDIEVLPHNAVADSAAEDLRRVRQVYDRLKERRAKKLARNSDTRTYPVFDTSGMPAGGASAPSSRSRSTDAVTKK